MIYIFGSGMAGLLAATMLRHHDPVVIEIKDKLPDNHGALLRFRSAIVSDVTHIPFTEVEVQKGYHWGGEVRSGYPPISAINSYAHKVTGEVLPRSIMNLNPSTRWIAPDDFLKKLAKDVEIQFGTAVTMEMIEDARGMGIPIISTIPMPSLMKIVGWPDAPVFRHRTIISKRGTIESPRTDVYQTVYYPDPEMPFYRVSITGNTVIAESMDTSGRPVSEDITYIVRNHFGIYGPIVENVRTHVQNYGKLSPMDESVRRAFILAMTERWGIHSLGRFGTWRQILLDDVAQDVRIIERIITERDRYSAVLKSARRSP